MLEIKNKKINNYDNEQGESLDLDELDFFECDLLELENEGENFDNFSKEIFPAKYQEKRKENKCIYDDIQVEGLDFGEFDFTEDDCLFNQDLDFDEIDVSISSIAKKTTKNSFQEKQEFGSTITNVKIKDDTTVDEEKFTESRKRKINNVNIEPQNTDFYLDDFNPFEHRFPLDIDNTEYIEEDTDESIILNNREFRKFEYKERILNIQLIIINNQSNTIKIETNLIRNEDILGFFDLNNVSIEKSENKFNIIDDISKALKGTIHRELSENVINFEITGFYDVIENLYEYLLKDFNSEYTFNEKLKVYEKIMNLIYKSNDKVCAIKTFKLFPLSLTLRLFEMNILTIADIQYLDCSLLSIEEMKLIYNSIEKVISNEPIKLLNDFYSTMKERDLKIIKLRSIKTLEQVGKIYNCTRERIRQIEKKTIEKFGVFSRINNFYDALRIFLPNSLFFSKSTLKNYGLNGYLIFNCSDEQNKLNGRYFFVQTVKEVLETYIKNMPNLISIDEMMGHIKVINKTLVTIDEEYYFCENDIHEIIGSNYKFDYGMIKSQYSLPKYTLFKFIVSYFFKEGIDIYNTESINKFKSISKEYFNLNIDDTSERSIASILQKHLDIKDKGIYYYNDSKLLLDDDLSCCIKDYIKKQSEHAISYKEVFEKFYDKLLECGICNRYQLASQLKMLNIDGLSNSRDYIFTENSTSMLVLFENIEKLIFISDKKLTRKEIEEMFPEMKYTTFQNLLNNTNIISMNGYFTTIEKLAFSDDEHDQLLNTLNEIVDETKIYHAKEVFEKSHKKLQKLFNKKEIDDYLKFYHVVNKMFPYSFSYNRPFISHINVQVKSGKQQIIEKIKEKGVYSIKEELKLTCQEIGYIIYSFLEFVISNNDSFIFQDHESIITLEKAGIFDELFDKIDDVLDEFLGDNKYDNLTNFKNYWKLPSIEIAYNEWVLSSLITKYSQKYYVHFTSNILSEASPIIVANGFDERNIGFDKITVNQEFISKVEEELLFLFKRMKTDIIVCSKLHARMNIIYSKMMSDLGKMNNPSDFYRICERFLNEKYYFEERYISNKEIKNISNDKIIYDYAKTLSDIRIDDLNNFADNMNLKRLDNYLKFINENNSDYVQIDYDRLLSKSIFKINSYLLSEIKKALSYYINSFGKMDSEKYNGFGSLPKLQYQWNKYLLVGIVRSFFSDEFHIEYRTGQYKRLTYTIENKKV